MKSTPKPLLLAAIQRYSARPMAQANTARTVRALAVVRLEEAICIVEDNTHRGANNLAAG